MHRRSLSGVRFPGAGGREREDVGDVEGAREEIRVAREVRLEQVEAPAMQRHHRVSGGSNPCSTYISRMRCLAGGFRLSVPRRAPWCCGPHPRARRGGRRAQTGQPFLLRSACTRDRRVSICRVRVAPSDRDFMRTVSPLPGARHVRPPTRSPWRHGCEGGERCGRGPGSPHTSSVGPSCCRCESGHARESAPNYP